MADMLRKFFQRRRHCLEPLLRMSPAILAQALVPCTSTSSRSMSSSCTACTAWWVLPRWVLAQVGARPGGGSAGHKAARRCVRRPAHPLCPLQRGGHGAHASRLDTPTSWLYVFGAPPYVQALPELQVQGAAAGLGCAQLCAAGKAGAATAAAAATAADDAEQPWWRQYPWAVARLSR